MIKFLIKASMPLHTGLTSAQAPPFRTDGYYFFDSGADTVFVTPLNTSTGRRFLHQLQARLGSASRAGDPFLPDSTVPARATSVIRLQCFSSQTAGVAFTATCWSPAVQKQLAVLANPRPGATPPLSGTPVGAIQRPDNSFILFAGRTPASAAEVLTGKMVKDQLVVSRISHPGMPPLFEQELTGTLRYPLPFTFYRFSEAPPAWRSPRFVLQPASPR